MDGITRAYYEVTFERDFLKKKANEFQNFFSEIMEKRYPGDFIRVRPWGNDGDRKNDGYLSSTRTLYQVYAPNELTAAKAIEKIDKDFNEALPHWQKYFDCWIFVHNSRNGLGPHVTGKLLELNSNHPNLTIGSFGFEELRQEVFKLNDADIASLLGLLGPAPSSTSMQNVGFESLRVVLVTIAKKTPDAEANVHPVSSEKLKANALSSSVGILLKAGMRRSNRVEEFFREWHDPTYGDQIAAAFKEKYQLLKQHNLTPDEIFQELQAFAGGPARGTTDHESAVLAVLAYLFEACDIFEQPYVEVTDDSSDQAS